MGELFNREFSINLGGTRVASQTVDGRTNQLLSVSFKVESSLSSSPNTAEVEIRNLSETTRAKVSEKGLLTSIEAGYSGKSSEIFLGKLEAGKSVRDGVDWITTFQSSDGGQELRSKRINISYKKITLGGALEKVAGALGVGLGNVAEKIAAGNVRGALDQFSNGAVLSGPVKKELDRLTSTLGVKWSIQNGQLQLLGDDDAIEPGDAVVISSSTGMIGGPESGEKGIVEVRSLLIPQLTPGRVVSLESEQITGFYRVEKVTYLGQTRGNDWYADLELKPR